MAVLIDSSVFIDMERRRLTMRDVLDLVQPNEDVSTSSITVSELLVGAHLAESESRRILRESAVELLLQTMTVLDFDIRAARIHSQIWTDLRRAGNLIAPHDLIIGAIALANGHAVLTKNVRDFDRIPGLKVRQPVW